MEKAKKKKPVKNHFGIPHINYKKERELCEQIKNRYFELKNDPLVSKCNILTILHEQYRVSRSTLVGWQKKWEITEPDWMPGDVHNYSNAKRIFPDSVEEGVSDYITENYIKQGYYFSDKEFKNVMFRAYNMEDSITKDFHCSPGFIVDFKNRHRFSSRKAHPKKRPNKELTIEEMQIFIAQIKSLIVSARKKDEPVINGDETGWRILPPYLRTWALKNAKNIIIKAHDDEYAHISAMASVTSDFKKLPLFLIAEGSKEEDMEKQLGDDIYPHVGTFTKKAYMSTDAFIEYLKFLRSQYSDEKKIHLIVDSYSSHKGKKVEETIKDLNISLTYIPDGYTDSFQPLDIAVFAVLKSIANAKLSQFLLDNPDDPIGMEKSVQVLIESWDQISEETIERGWAQYL